MQQLKSQQNLENPTTKWQHLFAKDLKEVDGFIISYTDNDVKLIPQIIKHIVFSGGKRLRPILTILCSKLCDYDGVRHIELAAAIELFHTATLLHDDVVDESDLRRGVPTANNIWGNAPSVLVGDFLLGKAFQILSYDGSVEVLKMLSDTSAIITEGEIKQLVQVGDITTSKEKYLDIIASKTAALFIAACKVGAMVADKGDKQQQALSDFGQNLGVAFQIIDDALDYSAKQEALGKNIGDDFREGKVTLPIILAYEQGNENEKVFIKRVIEDERDDNDLAQIITILEKYKILPQVIVVAQEYANKAEGNLAIFAPCDEKSALIDLLKFSVNRPH